MQVQILVGRKKWNRLHLLGVKRGIDPGPVYLMFTEKGKLKLTLADSPGQPRPRHFSSVQRAIYTRIRQKQYRHFVQISDIYKCTCTGVRYCHGGAIVQPGEIDSRPTCRYHAGRPNPNKFDTLERQRESEKRHVKRKIEYVRG